MSCKWTSELLSTLIFFRISYLINTKFYFLFLLVLIWRYCYWANYSLLQMKEKWKSLFFRSFCSLPSSLLQGQLVTLFLLTYFNSFLAVDLVYYLIYNHNLEHYMITVSKYRQMSPPIWKNGKSRSKLLRLSAKKGVQTLENPWLGKLMTSSLWPMIAHEGFTVAYASLRCVWLE